MSRALKRIAPVLACLSALLLGSCAGGRKVELHFLLATGCEGDMDGGPGFSVQGVQSVRTRIFRVDGRSPEAECVAAPLTRIEDLVGVQLLNRVSPSDGIEIQLTAWDSPNCGGELVFRCGSFGDAAVDLTSGNVVRLWCDCPFPPDP